MTDKVINLDEAKRSNTKPEKPEEAHKEENKLLKQADALIKIAKLASPVSNGSKRTGPKNRKPRNVGRAGLSGASNR